MTILKNMHKKSEIFYWEIDIVVSNTFTTTLTDNMTMLFCCAVSFGYVYDLNNYNMYLEIKLQKFKSVCFRKKNV